MELSYYRKAFWHFRHGGLSQLRKYEMQSPTTRKRWFYDFPVSRGQKSIEQLREMYVRQQASWEEKVAADPSLTPRVSTLISTIRPHRIGYMLDYLTAQRSVELQVLIATHGFEASDGDRARARELGLDVTWIAADPKLSLGGVYNQVLEHADQPWIAKFDDDDFYGEHYLLDSAMMASAAGADLIGKHSHFVYIESLDAVYQRFHGYDHRYSNFLTGATILGRTDAVHELGFTDTTVGEDSDLLEKAFHAKMRLYSGSPFGYCTLRGASHTWAFSDERMLGESTLMHSGGPGEFECV